MRKSVWNGIWWTINSTIKYKQWEEAMWLFNEISYFDWFVSVWRAILKHLHWLYLHCMTLSFVCLFIELINRIGRKKTEVHSWSDFIITKFRIHWAKNKFCLSISIAVKTLFTENECFRCKTLLYNNANGVYCMNLLCKI